MADQPTDPMSNPALGIMDPAAYAQMVRKQQLAQLLQQEALQPIQPQDPRPVGPYYVQPRVGKLSGLTRIAEALMAGKANRDSLQANAQMMGQMLQQFQPGGAPPVAPSTAQGATPLSGYQGGAGSSDVTPAAQAAAPRANPMNPTGLPGGALMRLYLSDPAKYIEAIKGTPDWQNALLANGGNVEAARRQMLEAARNATLTPEAKNARFAYPTDQDAQRDIVAANLAKGASLENKAGGENMIPTGRRNPDGTLEYQFIRTPNTGQGQDFTRGPDGQITAIRAIPGAPEAEQTLARAKELGTTQGGIHEFQTQAGGSRYYTPPGLTVPGAPGSPESGQPPARYFPSPAVNPALPEPKAPPGGPVPAGVSPIQWSKVPTRPNTASIGEDPYVKATVGDMAKKNAELSDKYGSEADLADQRIAFNNEALKVLSKATTGPMYETVNTLKKRAEELGIPAGWLPGGDVNSTDELKKFLLRNPLLSLKPTFGGRPAASEFQVLANEASPSPMMMQGAIRRLVQLDNQAAGFSKQRATDYTYYHDQLNGNPMRFESYYANRVPFAKWLDDHPMGRAGESVSPPEATATHNGIVYEKRGGVWKPATQTP